MTLNKVFCTNFAGKIRKAKTGIPIGRLCGSIYRSFSGSGLQPIHKPPPLYCIQFIQYIVHTGDTYTDVAPIYKAQFIEYIYKRLKVLVSGHCQLIYIFSIMTKM